MKKYFLLVACFVFVYSTTQAQNIDRYNKKTLTFLKFLPSSASPEDLRPSDIPSEQVLKQMGLSNEKITQALDFKFGKGIYSKNLNEVSDTLSNTQKLYLSFDDTLLIDSLTYPKSYVYG